MAPTKPVKSSVASGVKSDSRNGRKQDGSSLRINKADAATAKLSKTTTSADGSDRVCKGCDQSFSGKEDKLIECERCGSLLCLDCSKLTSDEYVLLTKTTSMIHWYCPGNCEASAMSAVKTDNLIEDKCKQYFDDYKAEMLKLVEDKESKVEVNLSDFKNEQKKVNEDLRAKIDNCTSNAASMSCKEILDREDRKCNIVLLKVPESNKSDGKARQSDDEKMFSNICGTIGVDVTATKVIRLGKPTTNVRPMRVTLNDTNQVKDILKSARKLNEARDETHKAIIIKRDQTPLEREETSKLLQERYLKQRESDQKGESAKWIIRRGEIVNVQRG